jgi:hypothetical protein
MIGHAVSKPLVYLVNNAGIPNYGDELIAAAWLRHLAGTLPEAEVVVDCVRPSAARETLGGIHPGARFTSTVWPVALLSESWKAPDIAAFAASVVADPGRLDRLAERFELLVRPDGIRWEATPQSVRAGIEDLVAADVVHLVGGGYVNTVWPVGIGAAAAAGAALRRGRGRGAATGQGFVPLDAQAVEVVRDVLETFAVVDTRDAASAELVGGRAETTADDVFLDLGAGLYSDRNGAEVLINAQADHGAPAREVADFVVATLREWGVPGDRASFVECRPGADSAVFELVRETLPGIGFVPLAQVLEHGLPAGGARRWISTRFHPHLVAAAGGLPGVAISVQPDYYDTKHGSLLALDSGWELVTDLGRPAPRPEGEGFPLGVLDRLRERKLAVADQVYGSLTTGR